MRVPVIIFGDGPSDVALGDSVVVEMPVAGTTKDGFLADVRDVLKLPGYYGENWDALHECLSLVDPYPCRFLILWHAALPEWQERDVIIYLAILVSARHRQREIGADRCELVFAFSSRLKNRVISLIAKLDPEDLATLGTLLEEDA